MRVPADVARRLRAGHPWIFREALGGRPLREQPGDVVDVLDDTGGFVGRGLFDPTGVIAIRMFSRGPSAAFDPPTIQGRVRRAKQLRGRFIDGRTTAYRVVHAEADGLPGLVVDRFADYLVAQLYTPAVEPYLAAIHDALEDAWRPKAIYEQRRYRPQAGDGPRAPAELVRGAVAPVEVEVSEEDLRFAVDVTAPLGTGIFPDLRLGRLAVRRRAEGRRVLNLFSYTGAFSLHAARGGASETVSVDLSSKAHGRARRNLGLNGLTEDGHEFLVGDAVKVITRMADRGRLFDLVVVDPPSFAQTKAGVFSAQQDYANLVATALSVLSPGGLLACASNTGKLSLDEFDRVLGEGADRARRELMVVERVGLPPDFPVLAGHPEGHYLKFALCVAP